jgi:hypothetical protein
MMRHCAENALSRVAVNGRRLTLTALLVVGAGALASPRASAQEAAIGTAPWMIPADDNNGSVHVHVGNGNRNKIYAGVLDPTIMRGVQQVSNTTVGGATHTQVVLCKKHRVCKIRVGFRHGRNR